MAQAINMPKMGNTVESVIVGEIFISVGDQIKKDQKLFSYETDKSTTDYKSEIEGEVLAILMESGEEVDVLVPVIIVGKKGDDISQWTSKSKEEPSVEQSESPKAETKEPVKEEPVVQEVKTTPVQESPKPMDGKISWRAKSVAKDLNVDVTQVNPTGVKGRIVEKDILTFYHSGETSLGKVKRPDIESKLVPYSPMRGAIAKAMTNSLQSTSQLSMGITFDASEILKLRAQIKKNHELLGIANASVNDILVFALSRVLPKFPHLNATLEQGGSRQHYIAHVAVAVDTPNGLFVPVVKDASLMSLNDIALKTKELVVKTREGKLGPDEMKGGTFTITNLGLSGVSFFTPILNYPQVAILGVGSPIKRLRLNQFNQVEEYPEITLSLTMDHNPNDGVAGTVFLKELVKVLENITVLFI